MILPVVRSYLAIALSVELAGQWTSPVPSQTATRGLQGVPAPVTVTQSTDILIIGLAGSVLSTFRPVTLATEPPPVSSVHSVSKSLLLPLTSFCHVVPHRGTPTQLLPCGHVNTCFSYGVRSANLNTSPLSHLSPFILGTF